jgi:hypothetical protein
MAELLDGVEARLRELDVADLMIGVMATNVDPTAPLRTPRRESLLVRNPNAPV